MKAGDTLYQAGDVAAVVQGASPDGSYVWYSVWRGDKEIVAQRKILRATATVMAVRQIHHAYQQRVPRQA
jgi:hypothetical protein